ncbi:unnamed protein product [Moneuplotes crassus]|uniref:Uncharacterized protein n=1 Tax=Euplotes crassus TaxID=5936 RepID=A0AAD2D0N7_EUPCR|nr:unnamed protein product [Moneuplotes crassus]
MQTKGVSQSILDSLSTDAGFVRYCTEWVSQRWEIHNPSNIQSTLDQIQVLKDQIDTQKKSISKMKLTNSKAVESSINSECLDLEASLLKINLKKSKRFQNFENYSSDFLLNLKQRSGDSVWKVVRNHKIVAHKSVRISFHTKKQMIAKKFLEHSFPSQTNELLLDNGRFDFNEPIKMSINNYFQELTKVLQRVTHKVTFYEFEITQKQLRKLLSCCRDKGVVAINECKIHIETPPDFSQALSGCNIHKLSFNSCGIEQFSDWTKNPKEFENLIHGLSKSKSLLESLKCLNFNESCIPKNEFERVFTKYGVDINLVSQNLS